MKKNLFIGFMRWLFLSLILFRVEPGSTQILDEAPSFFFETLDLPDGNLGNYVQHIAQDSFGFMWFATQFGLYRWDGYEIETYLKNPEDAASIASNYVECLYVEQDGTLWVGHLNSGLDRFNYETESFEHFLFEETSPPRTGINNIQTLTEDRQGKLWIGTQNGLVLLDKDTRQFKTFVHDPDNVHSISFGYCMSVLVDSEGTLWAGTGYPWVQNSNGGLNKFRPETQDFIRFNNDPQNPTTLSNNKVTTITEDSKGDLWVGTVGDGLHIMDRKAGKFKRLDLQSTDPNQIPDPQPNHPFYSHIQFIMEDQDNNIWIGSSGGGITCHNPATGYTKVYYHKKNDPQSLPEFHPRSILQSRDGTIWACTHGMDGKLFKFRKTKFEYYPIDSNDATIFSFCSTQNGTVWVGTMKSGLFQFNKKTKELTSYNRKPELIKKVNESYFLQEEHLLNFFLNMLEGKDGHLWIRKYAPNGLLRINPETADAVMYQHNPNDNQSIGKGTLTDIIKDEQDRIWSVTSRGDLNLYNEDKDNFIKYNYTPFEDTISKMKYRYSSQMTFSKGGKIWILSKADRSPQLTRFDPETEKFEFFRENLFDDPVFNYENIQRILEDKKGNLWICSDTKLQRMNPFTGESIQIRASEMGANYFKGMVIDGIGRIWLIGDKITIYEPVNGEHTSYVTTYSIEQSANMTEYIYKDSEGIIYIGGKGGFQYWDPSKIENATSHTAIESIIKDFRILYQNDDSGKSKPSINIFTTDEVRLAYNENAFSLRFATLGFQHPESNRIEFQLKGYDEQWRPAGADHEATYVKVSPGNYTFKVRGATLQGNWGPEKSISIIIAPPWWASWWAYSIYFLSGLSIFYYFYSFQINRKLEKAEAHRLKELDTVKSRLYTNITHEFRTPLTVISGMADQIEKDPNKWLMEGVKMIQRNTNRLLDLVNQMLDLSKLESGKMAVNWQQGDIIIFIKYFVDSIHSLAQGKDIRIHFYADEDKLFMDFDHEKLQQVMINLLSNAVKFTPEGGDVYVTVMHIQRNNIVDSANADAFLQIKIRDTGPGILDDQIPFIFDRFYQIDDSETRHNEGSGIGLALVKELIKLMEGDIYVKSKFGKETEFIIDLPIRNMSADIAHNGKSNIRIEKKEKIPKVTLELPVATQQLIHTPLRTSKPIILLIEDHADVVAYIASCLKDNYTIQVGKDGLEGIEIATTSIPDLIITDVMMPHKDGFEVCATLKRDKRTSHIPIIMLTAKADMESKLEGLEKGADAYLAKPFHPKELTVRIKKLLELRKELQEYYLALSVSNQEEKASRVISEKPSGDELFVDQLKTIVEAHLDDINFTVEQYCREIGMSHSQLHRKMTALTGFSPNRFIRYIRLNKAKKLLNNPDTNIAAVAYDTGFNDPSYFGRVFKKEFGMTPVEWKENTF